MTFSWGKTAAAAVGAFSIAAQTVLIREYLVFFHGSEIAFGVFFGAWFFWIAAGSTLLRGSQRLRDFVSKHLYSLVAFYPIALFVGLSGLPFVRPIAGIAPYEPTRFSVLVLGALWSAGPVSFLTGLVFPVICERAAADVRVGAAVGYAIEGLGAVVGGVAATLYFLQGAGSVGFVGVAGLLPTVVAAVGSVREGRKPWVAVLVLILSVCLVLPWPGSWLKDGLAARRLAASLGGAVWVEDAVSPYQLLTIARMKGQAVVLADGEVVAALPSGPDAEAQAALLASLPEKRDRAVVIGQGGLGLATALTSYFAEVRCVLIDGTYGQVFKKAQKDFGYDPRLERVAIEVADERAYARTAPVSDLFVIAGGEPTTLLANRLYTQDFLATLKGRLARGGVVAAPVRSAENYLGTEVVRYGQSVFKTIASVFSVVKVVPGEQALIVAGDEAGRLVLDPRVLADRYEAFAPAPRPFPAEGFVSLLPPDRVARAQAVYSADAPGDLINRDSRPLAPLLHLLFFLRESDSPLVGVLWAVHDSGPFLGLGLFGLLIFVVVRERVRRGVEAPSFAASVYMGCAGGASITGYVAVLSAYQAKVGAVFGEIGLATALFMSGLAGGAYLSLWVAGRARNKVYVAVGFAALGALFLAVLPFLLEQIDPLAEWGRRAALLLILAVLGVGTGLAWPIAGHLARGGAIAATLEAADHWGAALLVSFTGSVVLALFGVSGTLWAASGLLVCAGIAVVADSYLVSERGMRFFGSRLGRHLAAPGFRYRMWPALLMFGSVALLFVWHASRGRGHEVVTRLSEQELHRFEEFEKQEFVAEPFHHHRLYGLEGPEREGVLATSQAVAPAVKGYGGPINVVVSVGKDGHIRKVGIHSHHETPSYVRGIGRFLKAFEGLDARKTVEVKDPEAVDAMTGATVTRDAVLLAVDQTRAALAAQVLGLEIDAASKGKAWWSPFLEPAFWYVVLSLIGLVIVHFWAGLRVRLAYLCISAVLGGFYFNLQLSASWLLALARGEWPVWHGNAALWLLSAGVIGLAIFLGPVYCAHMCPFGALQEMASRLGARLGLLQRPLDSLYERFRGLKYGVLALVVVALFWGVPQEALRFDPLQMAFSGRLEGAGGFLVGAGLVGSLLMFRFWCRVFCPVGAFLLLFNRFALLIGLVPARRYGACDLGVRGPTDIECLQCNRCVREGPRFVLAEGLGRRLAYVGIVAACALVVGWSFWSASSKVEAAADLSRRRLRTVDVEKVMRLIQEGKLSDKKAQYYVPGE